MPHCIMWMNFDLIDMWLNSTLVQKLLQMIDVVIGNTDGFKNTLVIEFFQYLPTLYSQLFIVRKVLHRIIKPVYFRV